MPSIEEIQAQLRTKPIERSFVIERDAQVDEESRTVSLAFASDKPVEHYFGRLILSMDNKSIRADRLKNGAPLLMDHNTRDQVGVVESFSIDGGVARALVRFDTDQRSTDIFNSVKNGIRRNVSVGFMIYELDLEAEKKGESPIYRSNDWEPYEISIVSVPADISVGVGRSLEPDTPAPFPISEASQSRANSHNTELNHMTEENVQTPPVAPVVESPATTRSAAAIAREETRREIRELAEVLGDPTLSQRYFAEHVRTGVGEPSEEAFKAFVRAQTPTSAPSPAPLAPAEQASRQGGVQLATSAYRGGPLKAFKGPEGQKQAFRAGMFFAAAIGRNERAAQFCAENGIPVVRAHGGGTDSLGGFLVPDEFENVMIDLRIQYGVFRRNANVVPMSTDTKTRPRRTGGLTAYFRASGQATTESTKSWDTVTLVAKLCSVLTKYENELSEDAAINIGDDLVSEIAYAFEAKIDDCGFNGDGTSTYGGIVGVRNKLLNLSATRANIAGLQVASGNLWSEIVLADLQGVIAKLPQFARQSGNIKWYCSHEFYATVLMRLAQAVGGVTATEIQNGFGPSFFGIPVEITEAMPHTEANDVVPLLYGNLSQAAFLGDRKGTSIAMTDSDSTDFAKGIMAIRGDTRFDINVHDVGNQSSTASLRTPGPIVGLLTAAS